MSPTRPLPPTTRYDVVLVGAGLAGLTLARQLTLTTDHRILVVDRRAEVPPTRQKVGESTVQVSAHYLAKVLELEEHLWREHTLKYNLRFHWPTREGDARAIEGYYQAFLRPLSNIPTFQIDRNVLEAELLRRLEAHPNVTLCLGARLLDLQLAEDTAETAADHSIRVQRDGTTTTYTGRWLVDTTGRSRMLAKRQGLRRTSPIRHGAFYLWVDGLVDVERLTQRSAQERRLDPRRRELGHFPTWLATNHFLGEGFWLWVIPLRDKTSLGLVYDRETFPKQDFTRPEELIDWIGEAFPLFARDLPNRQILDHGGFRDVAYDVCQTFGANRWALSGDSGRFSDPLYSPGCDLIALQNTLIVDAIATDDPTADPTENSAVLARKTQSYDRLIRALYEAYLPSYTTSYGVLGDPEIFALKYGWELSIYFAFYVFPFLNDLFTDRRFILSFFKEFSRLGPINRDLQTRFHEVAAARQAAGMAQAKVPGTFDFTAFEPLRVAESSFYEMGVSVDAARRVLRQQRQNLERFAKALETRLAAAWPDASTQGEPSDASTETPSVDRWSNPTAPPPSTTREPNHPLEGSP